MTQTQKSNLRKRGGHCKRGEAQSSIIEFILKNNGSVRETAIREHLMQKHNITDQGGINKKLHELKKDGCIELVAPKKLSKVTQRHGLTNHWDINTFENLKSIRSHFNDKISLSVYDKSLDLILKQSSHSFSPIESDRLRTLLAQSPSFFNASLDTGPEILHARTIQIYRYGEGLDKYQQAKTDVSEFLVLYLKRHPDVEISEEEFLKLPIKQLTKVLAEILEELPDSVREDSIPKLTDIISFLNEERSLSLRFIAKYYITADILAGALSPEDLSPEDLAVMSGENLTYGENILASLPTALADLSRDCDKFTDSPKDCSPELTTRKLELYNTLFEEIVVAFEFDTEMNGKKKQLNSLSNFLKQEIKKKNQELEKLKQEHKKLDQEYKKLDQKTETIKSELEALDQFFAKNISNIRKESNDCFIKRLKS